jgi:RING finger/CHY zinc finger protein 1
MSEPGTSSQCSTPSTCSSPLAVGGCKHYQRNCHLLCPTCDEWFACRFCHDECKETPADRSCVGHKMDRHLVRMIQCQGCGAEQPPGSTCSTCGLCMGRYFCSVCNLFDDEDKQQFHCSDCGICRVGGRENFFHCQTCGACYSNDLKDNHVCISNSMKGQCPVCFDELFDSREPPQVLKCGHTIHRKCLEDYSQHGGFTCPLCSVSIIDMREAWNSLDVEIADSPMPDDLAGRLATVLCNDCQQRTTAAFHVIGIKCGDCGSYNTRRV